MDDLGNVLTDKELIKLENRIKKEYRQAVLEIQNKFDDYMKKYAEQDEKKAQEVKDGKMTFGQYRLWRKNKILRNKHYEELRDKLVDDMLNADKKAVSYINNTLPNIYATNINYETYNAEKETLIDTSFTLYNEDTVRKLIKENPQLLPIKPNLNIPKDLLWNKKHINSAITQGILQGEGIPKIAKRLERAANMDKSVAIRNARTCVTSAQNAGRLDAMKRERNMGIAIKKVWLATLDSRTRDSHVALDGEERELEENFSNGLIAPANDGGVGKPEECYNCRCRLGRQFDKYKTDWTNLENRRHDKLGNMSYEQWKEEHRKHAEEVAKRREKKIQTKAQVDDISLADRISDAYEYHRINNGLTSVPINQLGDFINDKVNIAKLGNMQKPFTDTLGKLIKEYDTPLQSVRTMTKEEYFIGKNTFARVSHEYSVDSATMVINPVKCGDKDKFVARIKELGEKGYAVKVKEGHESEYVATHEFAHTLLNMQDPLKQNWVNADFKKIKNVRKEVEKIYNDYLDELRPIEEKAKQTELEWLMTFDEKKAEESRQYYTQLREIRLSEYSLENSDEFMAEAFTNGRIGEKPNKYGTKILNLLDKYFRRKK